MFLSSETVSSISLPVDFVLVIFSHLLSMALENDLPNANNTKSIHVPFHTPFHCLFSPFHFQGVLCMVSTVQDWQFYFPIAISNDTQQYSTRLQLMIKLWLSHLSA